MAVSFLSDAHKMTESERGACSRAVRLFKSLHAKFRATDSASVAPADREFLRLARHCVERLISMTAGLARFASAETFVGATRAEIARCAEATRSKYLGRLLKHSFELHLARPGSALARHALPAYLESAAATASDDAISGKKRSVRQLFFEAGWKPKAPRLSTEPSRAIERPPPDARVAGLGLAPLRLGAVQEQLLSCGPVAKTPADRRVHSASQPRSIESQPPPGVPPISGEESFLARAALDLDLTLIHARKRDTPSYAEGEWKASKPIIVRTAAPSEVAPSEMYAEMWAVVHMPGQTYDVAVRVGTSRLLLELRAMGVALCVATKNQFGEELVEHFATERPEWRGIPVVVFEHATSKSLAALDLKHPRFAEAGKFGLTCVLDDAGGKVWLNDKKLAMIKVKPYSVLRPMSGENRYLCRVLADLKHRYVTPRPGRPSAVSRSARPTAAAAIARGNRPSAQPPSAVATRPSTTPAAPRRGTPNSITRMVSI